MTDGQLLERFIIRRDEAAFEAIVRRHGNLVLRVCRETLADPDDAEDAFQATFLVLVRNAATIRDRDSLGRWLYEVAYRVSLRKRAQSARRRGMERQVDAMAVAGPSPDPSDREVPFLLHAELNRLPERLRSALVLCYLEGHTQEEAARRLRCPLGTLKGRLTKGRELLRSRLARRGVAVTTALLLLLLLGRRSDAGVSPELIRATVRAGMKAAESSPPPSRDRMPRGFLLGLGATPRDWGLRALLVVALLILTQRHLGFLVESARAHVIAATQKARARTRGHDCTTDGPAVATVGPILTPAAR